MNHDKMTNISAKRGFLWPSFEIYSGVSGFTDYGPLGASLKNNIMQKWRKQYVSGEGFYEIEGPTVMPKEVLKASGHVDNFTDPMCKCKECGEVFRADHIIEEVIGEDVESLENEELDLHYPKALRQWLSWLFRQAAPVHQRKYLPRVP